jgi:hypothetical protein
MPSVSGVEGVVLSDHKRHATKAYIEITGYLPCRHAYDVCVLWYL